MEQLSAQLAAAWPYLLAILTAIGSAARAALVVPTFPWVAMAAVMGLCLPIKIGSATGGTWVRALLAGVAAFIVVAIIGQLIGAVV